MLNPFSTKVPLLYPLKTSENRRFSDVFRGYRSGSLVGWVKLGMKNVEDHPRSSYLKPMSQSYQNQSIDLLCKSVAWFLYDKNMD